MKKINWSNVKGVILDMDGVIYKGKTSIKTAIKAITFWQKKGIKICFLTNNSTKSQFEFSKKLKSMGLFFNKNSIISTSVSVANYLEENYNVNTRLFIVGSKSLKKTIFDRGFIHDENNATIVVAGLDEKLTYKKIQIASKLIRDGAKLIGTNPDKLYPTDKGFVIDSIVKIEDSKFD